MRKKESKEPKYVDKCELVGNRILEVSKSTKRKVGYVKIAMDDNFLGLLIQDQFRVFPQEINIGCLMLKWNEPVSKEK